MEQVIRDVALAAMTTLAALGGVWLAGLIAARHRHDDAKRETYATFLARVRDAESSLHLRADQPARSDPVSDNWADDVLNAYSLIQIVGSRDAVAKAKALVAALASSARPWMADKTDAVLKARDDATAELQAARNEFVDAARRDVGARD